MHFAVRHLTLYRYSAPVRLGTHRLLLAPRPEAGRECRFALDVTPRPVALQEQTDPWGNRVFALDFADETQVFQIESRFTLQTGAPAVRPAPLPHPAYLDGPDPGAEVRGFAAALAQGTDGPLAFLDRLNAALFTRTDRQIRAEGMARSPAETLALRSGACRDLTELFLACARVQGLPARFVSGYQAQSESPDGRRHLHAWPEVFLTGIGWRGYDPTHGLPVTDGHVALAVAPGQGGTMTVEGGFWGPQVTTRLDYDIQIDVT